MNSPSKPTTPNAHEQSVDAARNQVSDVMKASPKLPVTASYAELEQAIPEVAAMKAFDQRSDFHALTLDRHVMKVTRELKENPFVAGHPKRDLIILAGQLHDLGKTDPEGQQVHPKDSEKRQYVGHEEASERIVRELLPQHFELSEDDQEFVTQLAALHASALSLITSFESSKGQPSGKKLQAFDKFMQKADAIPGNMTVEEKMRIIFAFNRADKMGGYDETSDPEDPKVQSILSKAEQQIATLNEMEKALPAIIKAVEAKRGGDINAGVVQIKDQYYFNEDAPDTKKEAVTIPPALRPLGAILRDKMKPVAAIYATLEASKDDKHALKDITNGLLKDTLGLSDEQVAAVLESLQS